MRRDGTFISQRGSCAAWLYTPDSPGERRQAPAIVMAHGFSCVKEQGLDPFARRFAAAGFAVLAFDFRHLGQSEGEPRGQIFPLEQIEDYRNAITWLSGQPGIDADRIGAWGTSFSGGLLFHLCAFDRRVKAAVAQVPNVLNHEQRQSLNPPGDDEFERFLLMDRVARYRTGVVNSLAVVAPDGEPCVLAGQESHEWFTATGRDAPAWANRVTVESLEKIREYDPAQFIHLVAPAALLVIGAAHDALSPAGFTAAAFERAGAPKELRMLPCCHYDVYGRDPWFSNAADAAVEWFERSLRNT